MMFLLIAVVFLLLMLLAMREAADMRKAADKAREAGAALSGTGDFKNVLLWREEYDWCMSQYRHNMIWCGMFSCAAVVSFVVALFA